MSNHWYNLEFTAVVADRQHWGERREGEFENQDAVAMKLRAAMLQAGNDFASANPDLFITEVM